MAAKRREWPDDDGRTIADMNVDGMPWYTPGHPDTPEPPPGPRPVMTKQERRGYVWAAIRASLLVAAVFGAAYGLFLLFLDLIWRH